MYRPFKPANRGQYPGDLLNMPNSLKNFYGYWDFTTGVTKLDDGTFQAKVDADEFGHISGDPKDSPKEAIADALKKVAKELEES